jgi:two-component system CheB/CheR fusion protein
MCFSEWSEERGVSHPIQFFASDIDEAAIEKARQGVYPDNIAQDVSPERLRRFFVKTEQGYQITKAIREQCVFARQNLIKDPPFSKMDLISCRNLMIYFGPMLQKKALPILYYALNPAGYLMLGKSESIGEFSDLFSLVDKNSRIYSKKTSSTTPHFDGERGPARKKPDAKKKVEDHATGVVDIQKEADSIILNRYSPAGLVINEDMDILQFRGNISPYLKPQPGKASLNLMKMAGESLAMELRVLIRQAGGKDVAVRKEGIKVRQNGIVNTIDIEVVAFKTRDSQERLFLVIFEDRAAPTARDSKTRGKVRTKTIGGSQEDQVAPLVRELADSQQHLKSIIAEHEASTEELKALNEEVQSSNEELQSINEELETSKEELQSTNEELTTVNDELQDRNEEITQSNNDLVNVLSGVEIPILLIGNKLEIRRFNVSAGKALNLIATDIGRPISDIRSNINVPDLDKLVLEVIDSLTVREQEIQDRQGRWYSMTIRPYKTIDNRIDGAIVTLEDINDLKQGMLRVREARDYAEAIVETVREPLVVLSKDLRVVTANQAYYKNFAVTPEVIENKYFYDLQNGLWNIPVLRELLADLLAKSSILNDFEVVYEAAGVGRRHLLVNARTVTSISSEASLILLAIEDVTSRRLNEEHILKLGEDLVVKNLELKLANKELETFVTSVSHDLKAPLRSITGFSKALYEDNFDKLNDQGKDHLNRVIAGADKMERIIHALLQLSRISHDELLKREADMSQIAAAVTSELRAAQPDRKVELDIKEGLIAQADPRLLEIALTNLLGNAWKFTSKTENVRIEFGAFEQDGKTVYFVKDNGAGFDQSFSDKLFLPFQRLHSEREFDGTGVGLAIVERVVHRHGGKIWAEGKTNEGAAFFFTLK